MQLMCTADLSPITDLPNWFFDLRAMMASALQTITTIALQAMYITIRAVQTMITPLLQAGMT